MTEQNLANSDRVSWFWAKCAHDRGELSPELRKMFYRYLNGDRLGNFSDD